MIVVVLALAVIATAATRQARKRRSVAQVADRRVVKVVLVDSQSVALKPRRRDPLAGRP